LCKNGSTRTRGDSPQTLLLFLSLTIFDPFFATTSHNLSNNSFNISSPPTQTIFTLNLSVSMPTGQAENRITWTDASERHLLLVILAVANPKGMDWKEIAARFGNRLSASAAR
jgi:hypothetical protein